MSSEILSQTLSRSEAAEYLGVSFDTIRRMTEDGELPIVRIRSRVRIRVSALDTYLDEHEDRLA